MKNTINLRDISVENETKIKSSRNLFSVINYNRNIFLALFLLVLIAFTGGKIMQAAGVAPDPGHLVTEIGDLDDYYDTRLGTKTTDDLTEGATNFYYNDTLFDASLASKTTDDLSEGSNLYYTSARANADFDTRLAIKTTTDLVEGINLYFTNARARSAISATTPIAYNSSTGVISLNTVGINRGGTGQTTANAGFNALAPSQAGNAGRFLTTNGSNTSWAVVDKNSLGLGNVENTALSTWAGSSNILNLGTIATGSWQATPIADTYIASSALWNAKESAIASGLASQYFRGDKTWATLDTSIVSENGNLYYTTARHDADFDARLTTKTSDDISEGAVNLYYTDTRADTRIASASGVSVASLDGSGKIPTSQLPALAITNTFVVGDESSMLALSAETGDVAVRTDLNKSFILGGSDPTALADWQELLTPTDTVLSVNGQSGAVLLTTDEISEGANLYYTTARHDADFDARLTTKTSDDVSEGAVNKYYNITIYDVADLAALGALTGMKKGDVAIFSDESASYIYDGSVWKKLSGM